MKSTTIFKLKCVKCQRLKITKFCNLVPSDDHPKKKQKLYLEKKICVCLCPSSVCVCVCCKISQKFLIKFVPTHTHTRKKNKKIKTRAVYIKNKTHGHFPPIRVIIN